MSKVFYYIYCKGILGVKTNIPNFKWVYGSVAPSVSVDEYKKCIVKFDICVKSEKYLREISSCDKRFQSYTWNRDNEIISCRRTLLLNCEIGYNIKICENTVFAEIGEYYYKFIKNRTMNLHGIYYLLSDLANVLLLKKGFLTLYASAVYFEPLKKCVINFAPPNTGKTISVTKLCELPDCYLVGEDILISDGHNVYSCPWTNSYRRSNERFFDSAGSLGRHNKSIKTDIYEECNLTDLTVLSIGKKRINKNKDFVLKQISILNGYLFNYYSSPIVKMLGYFDKKYYKPWNEYADTLLKNMVNKSNCYEIQSEKSVDFAELIQDIVFGEKI